MPAGYEKSRKLGQVSLYELAQERKSGLTKEDHKQQVTEAWQLSDNAKSFVQALSERGYLLATGKQPYVVVDISGDMFALPRLIDDEAANTKQIRIFLGKDFPIESLPSVEEAQQLVDAHRQLTEKSTNEDRQSDIVTELKHSHQERRKALEQSHKALIQKQTELRQKQLSAQKTERDQLRSSHLAASKVIRRTRHENRPTGLAAFLGEVTGVSLIQKKLHKAQDAQRLQKFNTRFAAVKAKQSQEQKLSEHRFKCQMLARNRKLKSLEKVEKRELAALARDQQKSQRVRARGNDGQLPSLVDIAGLQNGENKNTTSNLIEAFEAAKNTKAKPAHDLMQAFEKAAQEVDEGEKDSGGSAGINKIKPLDIWHQKPRDRNTDPERGR